MFLLVRVDAKLLSVISYNHN